MKNVRQVELSFPKFTRDDLKEYRKTKDGAEMWCFACCYEKKYCSAELELLATGEALEAAEHWRKCLAEAYTFIVENSSANDDNATLLAEKMMLNDGYTPPHWKAVVECESCGFMPAPEKLEGVQPYCLWCNSMHRYETTEAKERIGLTQKLLEVNYAA
jgi:hypothetical protein